jgi:putative ABC transport system substrate-binding protein
MKRREFITLIGGAASTWPLAARAQQPARLPIIGFFGPSTPSAMSQWVPVFVQRLRELGWIEGRTAAFEYRWAEGRSDRFAEIAAEFVRLKVDVIVTYATPPVVAAKQATATIPIVSAVMGDPVSTGLVASLARPGGNVTGLSTLTPDLAGKRLELLREIVPGLRRLAFLANFSNPITAFERAHVQTAAGVLGLDVVPLEIRRPEDLAPTLETIKGRAHALYVAGDPLILSNRVRINTWSLVAQLPSIYNSREYVEAAGLMSYGVNWPDLFRRTADYVDKILQTGRNSD